MILGAVESAGNPYAPVVALVVGALALAISLWEWLAGINYVRAYREGRGEPQRLPEEDAAWQHPENPFRGYLAVRTQRAAFSEIANAKQLEPQVEQARRHFVRIRLLRRAVMILFVPVVFAVAQL